MRVAAKDELIAELRTQVAALRELQRLAGNRHARLTERCIEASTRAATSTERATRLEQTLNTQHRREIELAEKIGGLRQYNATLEDLCRSQGVGIASPKQGIVRASGSANPALALSGPAAHPGRDQSHTPANGSFDDDPEQILAFLWSTERRLDELCASANSSLALLDDTAETLSELRVGKAQIDRAASDFGELIKQYDQNAAMKLELAQKSKALTTAREDLDWFTDVYFETMHAHRWWWLTPKRWLARNLAQRLQKRQLFDSEAYLRRYPDVAKARFDPLTHYLAHGRSEGRTRA